jgi:hypothetical protein
MDSSPPISKRPSVFSVIVEAQSLKRQRIGSPPFDLYNDIPQSVYNTFDATAIDTTPDSLTTKHASLTPEPTTPLHPSAESITQLLPVLDNITTNTSRRTRKPNVNVNVRMVTTEVPQRLTEPYMIQTNCLPLKRKIEDFPMCMACISRQLSSGGCKFASLRAFPCDPQTGQFTSLSSMFVNSAPFLGRKQREATRNSKITYSTPGTSSDVSFIKSYIAPTLTSFLAKELVHEVVFREGVLHRQREAGVRPVCDGCATTIFSGHFMCCCCGREICLDCYSEWNDNEEIGWENLDSCSKKRRHTKRQMVPFTLFENGELERLIKDISAFPWGRTELCHERNFSRKKVEGFLPFTETCVEAVKEEDFQYLWGLGQPLVFTGCLERFKISWTPDHFIEHYGQQACVLVDCRSDKLVRSTVGKFFDEFLSSHPKRPLKLKVYHPCT